MLFAKPCHFLDGFRLILFNADNALRYTEIFQHKQHALKNVLALLHKATVVGGYVRLALRTVYNKEIGLFFFWVKAELQRGRKACAAKTYGAAVSYRL